MRAASSMQGMEMDKERSEGMALLRSLVDARGWHVSSRLPDHAICLEMEVKGKSIHFKGAKYLSGILR